MGTKSNPGKFDCYANALPDEPMFVLLARDPSASDLVRAWAAERSYQISLGNKPTSDGAPCAEAIECADAMDAWRKANDGKWRSTFRVGGRYRTQGGEIIKFVGVANSGTNFETMYDEAGVHRYTRRDLGRVTGSAHDYSNPLNTPPGSDVKEADRVEAELVEAEATGHHEFISSKCTCDQALDSCPVHGFGSDDTSVLREDKEA